MIKLLRPELCTELIQYYKEHEHMINVGNGSDYYGIRFLTIHTQWVRDLIFQVIYDLVGRIRVTNDQLVYPEMIAINKWPKGGFQDPHLDTYSNQEMVHGTTSEHVSREWTCILYLNDNYRGGRTYVPDTQVYEPKTGHGLLFQGVNIPHGVQKVRRNDRYTISFWFSSDPSKQMIQSPIRHNPEEDINEDSVRLIPELAYRNTN